MVWPCFNSLNVTLICVSILSLFLWEVKSHIPLWLCTWGVWIRIPSVFTHVGQPLKIWASAVRIQPVQSLSRVQLSVTPWTAAHQPSLSLTNCQSCSNSCPSSRWCHPSLSSSVIPFSSCLRSFASSESFPMSRLFASGGQSTGVSASAAVLPMNI